MGEILVTGSNGHTGSAVISNLKGEGVAPVAGISGRNKDTGSDRGVKTTVCNFGNREQIRESLQGVKRAYLMVPFNRDMVEWGRNFVAAASGCGVQFIVRLSGLGASPDSASAMGRLHGQIDECVKESAIDCCIVRCNSFMQNFTGHYAPMISRGRLRLAHGDARFNFIDTNDIASVISRVLLAPDDFSGQTLDLHGPQCLSNYDAVDAISHSIGRKVVYQPVTDDEATRQLSRGKLGEWERSVFGSLDRYFRAGHAVGNSAQLEQLLHRKPTTFAGFAQQHRQRWL